LSMLATQPKSTPVGDFKVEVWVHGFLGSAAGTKLFNLTADATDPAVKDAIMKEIKSRGGDAAINVTIEYQASFVNILLNSITAYIYAPGNLIITGTVVKFQ
jgi:hypothetical protein